ncbi:MAG: alginate export family protein [Bacteroidota bacterium]
MSAQFTLTGELRPRTEYRHGYKTLLDSGQQAGIFTSQRTRLNFNYISARFNASLVLQDVRTWGNQAQGNTYDINTYGLHEAWGEYWFTKKFGIRSGRQELSYDDERLMGSVSWNQQGRSHDALLFKYSDSTFTMHLGIAYNQNAENSTAIGYTIAGSYKELQFLWLNKKWGGLSTSAMIINNGFQSPVAINSTRYSQTMGTHNEYRKGAFFGLLKFYYQTGVDASKKDIQAYHAGAEVQYTLQKKIMLGCGFELMSGQSQTDTAKAYTDVVHNFSTLYGTGHKFNGFMDLYYAGGAHGNVGLTNVYLKTRYKSEKYWVGLDIHQFMAAADVLDLKKLAAEGTYSALDPNLGLEIDLTLNCSLSSMFSLQAGYSHYLPTATLALLKGVTDYKGEGYTGQTANWAYLMLIFKPAFIK